MPVDPSYFFSLALLTRTMDAPDPPLPSPGNGDAHDRHDQHDQHDQHDPTGRGLLETVRGGGETDVTISTPRGASPRKSRSGQKTIVSYSDRFIPSRCVSVAAGGRPDLCSFFDIFSLVPRLFGARWRPRFLALAVPLSLTWVLRVDRAAGLGRRGWTPPCWSWRRSRHMFLSRRRIRRAIRRLCTA